MIENSREKASYPADSAKEWQSFRMKLEIPLNDDMESSNNWFQDLKDKQIQILDQVLQRCSFQWSDRSEEQVDEAEIVCQQRFLTITGYDLQRKLLKMIKEFFKMIQLENLEPYMMPLLIFPTSDAFNSDLVSRYSTPKKGPTICDVPCRAFFWGNIQAGVYYNHWEVSAGIPSIDKQRHEKKHWVDFEFDRNDVILCQFDTEIKKRKLRYRIVNPKMNEKLNWNRETTVKCGRLPNEFPKDSELAGCPFFTIEFPDTVNDEKIYAILSRLRMRTTLPIEFGTFIVIDSFVKNEKPYFEWATRIKLPDSNEEKKLSPTSDNCKIFRTFLDTCIPQNNIMKPDQQTIARNRRFVITYLIECLLSRGAVVKDQICLQSWHWQTFLSVVESQVQENFDRAEQTLERLITMIDERKRLSYINVTLMQLYEVIKQEDSNSLIPTEQEQREGYQRVRKVIVTPTRIIYGVPEMMMSNRVLRKYDSYGIKVLRVSFRDDNGKNLTKARVNKDNIKRTVGDTLVYGLFIAGFDFGYLGSSNSQLREHGAYFMQKMDWTDIKKWRRLNHRALPPGVTLPSETYQIFYVRKALGKFEKIESIPKVMARLGQCFTQSRESGVPLPLQHCAYIHDVIGGNDSMKGQFTFTDGVGCVSLKFAQQMAQDFGIRKGCPSCFQFRYRGLKGVLGVNTLLDEHNDWIERKNWGTPPITRCGNRPLPITSWEVHVALRDSQEKFHGARQKCIEIVKVSTPSPVSLNRPFINILDQVSAMQGINCHKRVTERIQELLDKQMRNFANQMVNENICRNRLNEMPRRIDIDKLSTAAGFEMSNEVFFRSLIKTSVKFSITKHLRKAQIQIPFDCGRTMLGIADETGRLQYGQVFAQVHTSIGDKFPGPNASKKVLKGTILMTKNPCIIAGDVRIFEAVDIPELHHLVDVIVFPVHGPRPHPDEMAGSDLDGDEYCVIWDKELLFERNEPPFDFAVPKREDHDLKTEIEKIKSELKGQEKETETMINKLYVSLDFDHYRRIKQEKMAEFYMKYMMQSSVGIVANAFLTASDLYGINHKLCFQLAKKNNQAVDFTKSGQPPEPLTNKWTTDEETGESIPPEKSERVPDFQNDETKPMYQSSRLLGKLHREIKEIEDVISLNADKEGQAEIQLDPFLEVRGWDEFSEAANKQLNKYNVQLRAVMENYGIRSEAEIFSGCICEMRNRVFEKEKDKMSLFNTDQLIETKVTNIFRRFREEFFEDFGGWRTATKKLDKPFVDEDNICYREVQSPTEPMKKKAYAYYKLCYDRANDSSERLLSFAWLPYDVLANIKQNAIMGNPKFSIKGNPVFQFLEARIATYIKENKKDFEEFRSFRKRQKSTAVKTVVNYCRKYNGKTIQSLDKVLFVVNEWAEKKRLLTERFSSTHICLLAIMYFINGFGSLDGNALQLMEPIPIEANLEELEPENFGQIPNLLIKLFEFLSSRKFSSLQYLSFELLGVQSVFIRGEWMNYYQAAVSTYYNLVYNLRFDELPLREEIDRESIETIREMEPFTIELPDGDKVDDRMILRKLLDRTDVYEITMRRTSNNKAIISARGTLEALHALKRLSVVMPPLNIALRGRDFQEKIYDMVYQKITKEDPAEWRI